MPFTKADVLVKDVDMNEEILSYTVDNVLIEIGGKYLVFHEEEWRVGTIIKSRVVDKEIEFFVNYDWRDKRMDEWVNSSQIKSLKVEKLEELEVISNKGDEEESENKDRVLRNRGSNSNNIRISLDAINSDEEEFEQLTRIKYIDHIQFGAGKELTTWYYSPFPEKYQVPLLYMCEYCLCYFKTESEFENHVWFCCECKKPPGKMIYNFAEKSVFEVDGKENKRYCQSLSLLAKLFLHHKTVNYYVADFMFYVLCEYDREWKKYRFVGYFSKEKNSPGNHNLACIVVLPPYQRRSYGKFLIALSYQLMKIEGTLGRPEEPLSDLGQLTYESFWRYTILKYLNDWWNKINSNKNDTNKLVLNIRKMSEDTGIVTTDVISTLTGLNLIKYIETEGNINKVYIHWPFIEEPYIHYKNLYQQLESFLDWNYLVYKKRKRTAVRDLLFYDNSDENDSQKEDSPAENSDCKRILRSST